MFFECAIPVSNLALLRIPEIRGTLSAHAKLYHLIFKAMRPQTCGIASA